MTEQPIDSSNCIIQFSMGELFQMVAPSLSCGLMLVLVLQVLNWLDWLPTPAPVQSPGEVMMRRRFAMTRAPSLAEVLVIGDSSSAIDVEAPTLGKLLPGQPEVLNQGMFMGIAINTYGQAAGEFIRHHPGRVKLVVLLITAEQLHNADMSPFHQELWNALVRGSSEHADTPLSRRLLAFDIARDRIAGHLVPMTLYGNSSLFFGYTFHLRRHLPAHGGSMLESGWYSPSLNVTEPSLTISEAVRRESEELRTQIPNPVKLAAGISPLPESSIAADFKTHRDESLRELNQSLHADYLLTNLPVRLPDGYFSSVYHLNPNGAKHFTMLLAEELGKLSFWSGATNTVKSNP